MRRPARLIGALTGVALLTACAPAQGPADGRLPDPPLTGVDPLTTVPPRPGAPTAEPAPAATCSPRASRSPSWA
ncbi:hypothetical protein V2I01_10495 [Micromonospora sp. BRA006-A]|nr:hypothetical protein [Micromonospora sp. BRA006-A]